MKSLKRKKPTRKQIEATINLYKYYYEYVKPNTKQADRQTFNN